MSLLTTFLMELNYYFIYIYIMLMEHQFVDNFKQPLSWTTCKSMKRNGRTSSAMWVLTYNISVDYSFFFLIFLTYLTSSLGFSPLSREECTRLIMIIKSRVVDYPTTEVAEDGRPSEILNRTVGSGIAYKTKKLLNTNVWLRVLIILQIWKCLISAVQPLWRQKNG